jgi:hypothetical protein
VDRILLGRREARLALAPIHTTSWSNTVRKSSLALALLALLSGAAQAALLDRGSGLIYDTDLNITWLRDANYARTSGYDADGRMNWNQAATWAANLSYYDAARNVTYTDWRLPTTTNLGSFGAQCTYGGTDCGYNSVGSEMSHLFYTELGNVGLYSTTGATQPGYAYMKTAPFINLYLQSTPYWSTEYAPGAGTAWSFLFGYGFQGLDSKGYEYYAWAVRDGDVTAVPEARTYALMLAGLGLVAWRAKRRG